MKFLTGSVLICLIKFSLTGKYHLVILTINIYQINNFTNVLFQILLGVSYDKKKIVCYYSAIENVNFVPKIDPFICTHLVYVFSSVDATTNTIISSNPNFDIDLGK